MRKVPAANQTATSFPARIQACALLLLLGAAPAMAQRGALTVPRNINQLTDRAAIIVRGYVSSAVVEKHPEFTNLHTVVMTLRVREMLKGQPAETFTFRQYIWDVRDRYDAAGYQKGQQVLLLLLAPNQHGLSSPAGMEQGRFRILRDRDGNETAINGAGNFGLFEDVETQASKKGVKLSLRSLSLVRQSKGGAVAADSLVELIRELAGQEAK